MATPNETKGKAPRSLNTVAPQLPVFKARELHAAFVEFNIWSVSETRGGKFGAGWKLNIVRTDTGERGVILMGMNPVRDEQFAALTFALSKDPTSPIGPCVLESVDIGTGNDAWNIVAAPVGETLA